MKYETIDDIVIVREWNSFEIDQILECGQCFRFEKIETDNDVKTYEIIAFERVLNVRQYADRIEFSPCNKQDFENIWIDYFDLKRDYEIIKNVLYENDIVMRDAIEFARGIRILNQDIFEVLISFIISQNNRIPQIKKVIKNISMKYGSKITDNAYAFPTLTQFEKATDAGLRECKTGFRSKYILDALEKVDSGQVILDKNAFSTADEIKENLLQIKGVGNKVADCVLLFGFSRHEYFPTDVWIKRIMTKFYFNNKETSQDNIQKLANSRFGEYAGFAQQYLFNYAIQFPELFKN